MNTFDRKPNNVVCIMQNEEHIFEWNKQKLSQIKKYTDASKSAYWVGFAISQDNITLLYKLPPETCIFSAEPKLFMKLQY